VLKRIFLAGTVFIILFLLVIGIHLGKTQAQDEYMDERELLAYYGNELLDNQEKMLKQLAEMKKEINKIKFRVSR